MAHDEKERLAYEDVERLLDMSGRKIIDGLGEAISHTRGDHSVARVRIVRVPEQVDVRAIRQQLNMSQREFARRFGFGLDALQNWEQGRRFPDSTARILLKVIEHHPESVEDALAKDALALG